MQIRLSLLALLWVRNMRKNILFVIALVIVALLNALAFAQKNHTDKSSFNPEDSNQAFEIIQKKLEAHVDYNNMLFYVQQIENLQGDAKKCVADSESHLKIINDLLKSTQVDHVTQLQRADLQYLQSKQLLYTKQLSECRLFVYRSQEALVNYKDQIQKLSAYQILRREPVWNKQTLYITAVCFLIATLFFLWYRTERSKLQNRTTHITLATFLITSLVVITTTEWSGYHRLAVFIISGLCLTVVYTVSAVFLWHSIEKLYDWLDNKQSAAARKVHFLFGVKFNKRMHEIVLIKIAAHFVVLCFYVVLMLKSWSISSIFVDSIVDGLLNGFKFSGLTIIPSRIVFALISFSVIFLLGRFLATTIARKHRFKGEEDTQIAISTITIYISFAVAFLFAMLVTGVDFTGLAIIAGALSVGVGLGLQNIVNNFVSGLILLIEKPIKPGDRIVIGKTEGFVRKIRIRSTQIATLSKEDVIVPNADLITQQVTNYMFRDRNSRVSCQVGIAYGSDVELVKKLLLDVAAKHPDVVHESPNEPIVLFSRFGESALIFDLWCVIHDVNKKYLVVSDLNFAIDAAFRHHKIEIAFPQRDVHIKTPIKQES